MAEYRSNTQDVQNKIANQPGFGWNDFSDTSNHYQSRYRNIKDRIGGLVRGITDLENVANLGITIAQSALIKRKIAGESSLMSPWAKFFGGEPGPEYKTKVNLIKGEIERLHGVFPKSSPLSISVSRSRIILARLDGDEQVELQWVPDTLTYKGESKFAALVSVGRNNPFYHYGGSEDTLEFTIDWTFNDDKTRMKAVEKARWVEALSKSDGYSKPPPRVILVWGASNLFTDNIFIVESAFYEMKNWVDIGYNIRDNKIQPQRFGLLPQTIHQEIILKRVTSYNLKREDITRVWPPDNDLQPFNNTIFV